MCKKTMCRLGCTSMADKVPCFSAVCTAVSYVPLNRVWRISDSMDPCSKIPMQYLQLERILDVFHDDTRSYVHLRQLGLAAVELLAQIRCHRVGFQVRQLTLRCRQVSLRPREPLLGCLQRGLGCRSSAQVHLRCSKLSMRFIEAGCLSVHLQHSGPHKRRI